MALDLPTTFVLLALSAALFAFASWRARQPANPAKIRMINYHVVQILVIVLILLMLAHLVTLIVGHPLAGA